MKSVFVCHSEAAGIPDPNFFSVFEVGKHVSADKVRNLKDSGPFPYWLGVDLIDDGLMSPSDALLLCDADHVYLDI